MTEVAKPTDAKSVDLPVFISWSQSLAEEVGKILRDWLPNVVPGILPWYSPDDIETGKFWQLELFKSLAQSTVSILVVTPASANRPWLNFEAGRLSSSIESAGGVVMPLLINLELGDIVGTPLTLLNAVTFHREGVWKVVKAINTRTGKALPEPMLDVLFDKHWLALDEAVGKAVDASLRIDSDDARPPQRDTALVLEELIAEIRELRRSLEPRRRGKIQSALDVAARAATWTAADIDDWLKLEAAPDVWEPDPKMLELLSQTRKHLIEVDPEGPPGSKESPDTPA